MGKVECTNAKAGMKPKYYPLGKTTTSPKALGVCARHAKVGLKMKGADNRLYKVVANDKGVHRWRLAESSTSKTGKAATKKTGVKKTATMSSVYPQPAGIMNAQELKEWRKNMVAHVEAKYAKIRAKKTEADVAKKPATKKKAAKTPATKKKAAKKPAAKKKAAKKPIA